MKLPKNDQKYYDFLLDFDEFFFDFQMQYTEITLHKSGFFYCFRQSKIQDTGSSKPPGLLPMQLHQGSALDQLGDLQRPQLYLA